MAGWLARMFPGGEERAATVDPAHPRDPALAEMFGTRESASGVHVDESTAMRVSAVHASVKVLAESQAQLPLKLFRRLSDGSKEEARDHPLFGIVHDMPNAAQTSYEFREMMAAHTVLSGNSYAKVDERAGRVRGLVPLHPRRVRPFWANGKRAYEYQPERGARQILLQEEVLHIPGLSFDGLMGISPIRQAMESVGLALATERYGARFFKNDAKPGGYITHPAKLGEQAYNNLMSWWNAQHQGADNAHRWTILEEGMQPHQLRIENEQAQFLETRKFQVTDIARLFRVPPHMIADLERATFSNIEQQSLEFVKFTLMPWLVKWEQALTATLLTSAERATHFFEFQVDGLLRGDVASRSQFYSTMFNVGALSPNEVRSLENFNGYEGGDAHFAPKNVQTVENARNARPDNTARDAVPPAERREARVADTLTDAQREALRRRQELRERHRPAIREAVSAVTAQEIAELRQMAETGTLSGELQAFYDKIGGDGGRLATAIDAPVRAFAEEVRQEVEAETGVEIEDMTPFVTSVIGASTDQYVRTGYQQIAPLANDPARVRQRLGAWEQNRARDFADSMTVRVENATAHRAYRKAGRQRITRVNPDGANQTVNVTEPLVQQGQPIDAGIQASADLKHPPLAPGDESSIVAA